MKPTSVQSSPVQQMVAVGSPTWWSINNIRPPPLHQHQLPPPIPSSGHQFPQSWSQLLLGETFGNDDKSLKNWEQSVNHNPNTTGCWSQFHHWITASSPNSCLSNNSNMVDFSPKSSDLKHPRNDPSSECDLRARGGTAKKARIEQTGVGHTSFKVRKEKLGDRITALHQLVSPFGKTDTASVLLEAIGYIRFLQSQIEALSLPYISTQSTHHHSECAKKDLRSRGLCLVPISCTLGVRSDVINGADYWASAFGSNLQ